MGDSMKLNNTVITMALVGVLALAALAGGLLPMGNPVHAEPPTFDAGGGARSIPENTPPGVNIGDPISASDLDETGDDAIEFGNTLTYKLGGTDAASFDIDSSTGQLLTKAPLNADVDQGGKDSYSVTVTVDDGETRATPVTQTVAITVTDVPEAPGALAAPTVVSTDTDTNLTTYELKVIWYAPDDPGDGVTGYDVQYKKTTETSFGTTGVGTISGTTVNITGLEVDTSYQVRVRATGDTSGAENGPWSLSGVGSTNKKDNALPTFTEDTVARTVLEDADPGLGVGSPVSATDNDNVIPLAYQLRGPDADSFDLQASTGQIRTKRGVVYDHETKPTLNVTVTVSDGQGGTDARAVTITVGNVPEAPEAPARPTVRATPKSSRSLDVTWTEPENMGPAITSYDVRYRKGNSGSFTLLDPAPTSTKATIAPDDDDQTNDVDERLTPGASYEVNVRAKNGEIPSQWSAAGTGRTSIGNSEPTFDDRPNLNRGADGRLVDATTTRTVAENTRAGQSVGRAVRAVDGNGDTRTYRLVAVTASPTHVNNFDINTSTGQILTKAPLNHEDTACGYVAGDDMGPNTTTCTYTVMVQVWDGRDEHRNEQNLSSLDNADATDDTAIIDDEITVNITVSDVDEKPAAPTVTVTSPVVADTATEATLTVTWDRPENAGPALTGYVVECTGDGITTTNPCPQPTETDITDLTLATQTYTMDLTPSDLTRLNSYRVRVRADNNEGQGAWSAYVTQSTSKEGNNVPVFTGQPAELYVAENAPSAREPLRENSAIGNVVTVQATDSDNDTLTYRLDGPGAGRFDIDRNGQIRTTTKLNREDPACGYTAATPTCTYSVRVKASDPNGGSVSHSLTINVTNAVEPPAAPPTPRVTATSGSGWSLEVAWNAPRNDGPPITGYEIRYRKTGDSAATWQQWPHTGTGRSAKITTILSDPTDTNSDEHLEPRTQYEVQVRALNGEGDSTFTEAANWSASGRGTTGASNRRPTFASTASLITLQVDENTRSGQNIGSAVEATDPDKDRLAYALEGPGKDSFTITSDGQIRTRAALNYEEKSSYSVTVKVDDRQRKSNSIAAKSVTIVVINRPEIPTAPRAPMVSGIPGSTDSVRVTWDEPANQGPPITHYSVQLAVSGSRDGFRRVEVPTGSVDRSVIITGLTSGTRYEVQVRAESPEGHSDWSRSGTGSPNPDVENRNPAFSSRSHTFNVDENTPPGADVGDLVAALDPDGDTLTYSLEGVDADSFDIIATNGAGQIQTKAALNHEEKASYSVAVRARDGRGGTDAVNVTIRVTDVDNEAPDTPFAPAVTAVSSTSLQVRWDAPANTGPPITDYDYRYMSTTDTEWTEVTNTTISGTTVTVEELTPSTSYDVEVLAKNAEGSSGWSNPGNGATNAPGANNPPVFTEGTSATRSVSATSPSGTNIGEPVAATDADAGDTITYSLEGRDAPSFDIGETNGQLRTKSGITLIVGTTYTVTVAADDTKDITRITVSIEATAAPPNNPPVFTEGASTTRSIREGTVAGASIGGPVRATDADTGDTLTYALEGTDAASFTIVSTSGQIRTQAPLDASTKSTYSVTVRATDSQGGTATIAVTINVTAAPTTLGCGTRGAVADASNTGLVADCEALLKATERLENGARILNWSVFRPIEEWDGIRGRTGALTGTPKRVTELWLHGRGLSGTIAPELGELSELKWLYLHRNNLTGEIPGELNNLSKLERLYLYDNDLTGISSQIGPGMSQLRRFFAHRNNIGGTIPTNLGDFPRMDWLRLDNNNLNGPIPSQLGDLSSLRRLYLHQQAGWRATNGGLTGSIPSSFSRLTRLEYLVVHRNSLSGPIPADLRLLSNLVWLGLYDNSFTGQIPSELGSLSNLERLYLHGNQLAGTVPGDLAGMISLTNLWLRDNQLSGQIPTALGTTLTNLERVRISGNNFSGCIPAGLLDGPGRTSDAEDLNLPTCPN